MFFKGYIAGSLFNEAEVNQRLKEGQMLRDKGCKEIEWFNPIEQPCNDKSKLVTSEDIFKADTQAVIDADFIIADITNNDVGVAMELGIAYGLQYARAVVDEMFKNSSPRTRAQISHLLEVNGIKEKNVYAVNSDIRMANAGKYNGIHVPYGVNQYLVGGIECMNGVFVNKFEEAIPCVLMDKARIESEYEDDCE